MPRAPTPFAWDDFRLVKAVADCGGLTRAAARLGINHSTAFRRLEAVEATLGARLFERHRSGYAPTGAGKAMAAAAARMEEDVARFGREVAASDSDPSGELRVTAPASFVTDLLMPILGRFVARHPAIRLDLVVAEEALNLSRRDADVAIRASDDPLPSLVGRRLAGVAWAVYGRSDRDYPEPAACTWICPAESVAGGRFTRFVHGQARPERVALSINTVLGLREAVLAGLGVAPLPCLSADGTPELRRLSGPDPELESALWLLTHADLRHAGRVRAFMDFVADEIAPLRPLFEGRRAGGAT